MRYLDKSLHIPYKELTFGETLGKGFFGEVRQGRWRGSDVAIKVIYRKSFRSDSEFSLFEKELGILRFPSLPSAPNLQGFSYPIK